MRDSRVSAKIQRPAVLMETLRNAYVQKTNIVGEREGPPKDCV